MASPTHSKCGFSNGVQWLEGRSKEKGQPPTWSLAYWGLDELGSIEWRGMMAVLIPSRYQSKESERLAANRAASPQK